MQTRPLMWLSPEPALWGALARRYALNGHRVVVLDGGVYTAVAAVNWARGPGLFDAFSEINQFDAEPVISRGIAFVPALAGLACPHWRRAARGAWMGRHLAKDQSDIMQAVLEGVALRMAEVVAAMSPVQPLHGPIPVDGRMAQNPYFCRFLADTLQEPLRVSLEPEVTALGCAAMAADGLGVSWPAHQGGAVVNPQTTHDEASKTFDAARRAVERFAERD